MYLKKLWFIWMTGLTEMAVNVREIAPDFEDMVCFVLEG